MTTIVVDSGPLYAAFDRDDKYHRAAIRLIGSQGHRLLTNMPVITEVAHLLGKAPKTRLEFLRWAHVTLNIDEPISDDFPRIVAILEKHSDLRPDFADASLVALCERIDTRRIATINGDFKVYRTIAKKPFENVFDMS